MFAFFNLDLVGKDIFLIGFGSFQATGAGKDNYRSNIKKLGSS